MTMPCATVTRRDRRIMKRIAADFPYLAPLFARVEALAAAADQRAEAARPEIEAAERRERDMAREMARLRTRIAELESKP